MRANKAISQSIWCVRWGLPLPLPPALSLRETEIDAAAAENFEGVRKRQTAASTTPSPWGEGDRGARSSFVGKLQLRGRSSASELRPWFSFRHSKFGFQPA